MVKWEETQSLQEANVNKYVAKPTKKKDEQVDGDDEDEANDGFICTLPTLPNASLDRIHRMQYIKNITLFSRPGTSNLHFIHR
jgi:hypothetical protein